MTQTFQFGDKKAFTQKEIWTPLFMAVVSTGANIWNQSGFFSMDE